EADVLVGDGGEVGARARATGVETPGLVAQGIVVDGGDGDRATGAAGRAERVALAAVAGGDDVHDAGVDRGVDRLGERLEVADPEVVVAAEAHVADVAGDVERAPLDGGDDVGVEAAAVGGEDLGDEERGAGGDAGVGRVARGDDAGDVRAVAVVILGDGVVVDEVVLGGDGAGEGGVGLVDARVEHAHAHAGAVREARELGGRGV